MGLNFWQGQGHLSSPHPDRFWKLPSLLFIGYWQQLPLRNSSQSLKLTTHLLVPKSRMCESIARLHNFEAVMEVMFQVEAYCLVTLLCVVVG